MPPCAQNITFFRNSAGLRTVSQNSGRPVQESNGPEWPPGYRSRDTLMLAAGDAGQTPRVLHLFVQDAQTLSYHKRGTYQRPSSRNLFGSSSLIRRVPGKQSCETSSAGSKLPRRLCFEREPALLQRHSKQPQEESPCLEERVAENRGLIDTLYTQHTCPGCLSAG